MISKDKEILDSKFVVVFKKKQQTETELRGCYQGI
jgi:hypothetical protein